MKRNGFVSAMLALIFLFVLTGCSGAGVASKQTATNKVEETMNAQIAAAEGKESDGTDTSAGTGDVEQENQAEYAEVDYDLTKMNSDMVYSTVLNMLTTPEDYWGKTVRMKGPLTIFRDDAKDTNYYACVIADAAACCSQGIEFVWGDGSRSPSEYPEEGTKLEVTGVFSSYEEDGIVYCRLNNAALHVVQFDIT